MVQISYLKVLIESIFFFIVTELLYQIYPFILGFEIDGFSTTLILGLCFYLTFFGYELFLYLTDSFFFSEENLLDKTLKKEVIPKGFLFIHLLLKTVFCLFVFMLMVSFIIMFYRSLGLVIDDLSKVHTYIIGLVSTYISIMNFRILMKYNSYNREQDGYC